LRGRLHRGVGLRIASGGRLAAGHGGQGGRALDLTRLHIQFSWYALAALFASMQEFCVVVVM
jgi:hypothetical protein